MKLLFCKVGLHWRMSIIESLFVDVVSGKTVFEVVCPCGKRWMMDSISGFPLFKVPLSIMIKHILGFFEDLKAWWVTPITASDIKAKLTPAPKEKPDYGDVLRPNPMNREPNLLDLHDDMMENARKTYFGDAFEQRARSRFGYEMAVAEHERFRIEMHIRDINEALKDTEDEKNG